MNRKLTLILAFLILAVVSVSVATAVNDTQDDLAADDDYDTISQNDAAGVPSDDKVAAEDASDVSTSKDTDKLGDGGVTIEKVWDDDNNAAGKRPSSIKFAIIVDGQETETGEIRENMSWKATLDLAIIEGSTYEVVEKDVPDGYKSNVTGSVSEGFVINNTLKDVPKNDTDKNSTPKDNGTGKNATANKDPDSKKPSYTGPKQVTKITTKTKTTETPVKNDTKNDTKNHTKKTNNTGNPILIGIVAVALAGLAYALYRRQK